MEYKNNSHKKRMVYLDLFRIIAAVSVVIIHITASSMLKYKQGSNLQLIVTLINGLSLFAVPAFIFISSYTFIIIYKNKSLSSSLFFKKKIISLLLPYFIWTLIYYFLQLKISKQSFQLFEFFQCILFGTAFYHLYFMPIIIQFYLLFIPLKHIVERFSAKSIIYITIFIYYIYTSGIPFSNIISILYKINDFLILKSDIYMSDRFFISYLPFYILGLVLGYNEEKFQNFLQNYSIWILFLYIIISFIHVYNRIFYYVYQKNFFINLPYSWELSSIMSIFMILWLTKLHEHKYVFSNNISLISNYTFDLYLMHPLVLAIGEYFLYKIGIYSITLHMLLLFILGVCFPLIYSHFKRKIVKELSST